MSSKLLFIINGLGLGNSTRCASIIKKLVFKGYEVDVVTSGNGLLYFQHCSYVANVFSNKSLNYGKSATGDLSMLRTFFNLPALFRATIENRQLIKRILKGKAYCGIVIDSEYTFIGLKRFHKVPLIALNNSDIVMEECAKLNHRPESIRYQLLIERLDFLYHKLIPDLVISPYFQPHKKVGNFHHLPPIIRPGLFVNHSTNLKKMLVMMSGSQLSKSPDFLKGLKPRGGLEIDVVGKDGSSNGWIKFHGRVYDNENFVNAADMMVINGGFSAVSEAIVLKKPAVIIPIKNHAEQFINAYLFEKFGLGLSATEETAVEKIEEVIDRFDQFKRSHDLFDASSTGAEEAANIIEAFTRSNKKSTINLNA